MLMACKELKWFQSLLGEMECFGCRGFGNAGVYVSQLAETGGN
jgi:hypothetical protein